MMKMAFEDKFPQYQELLKFVRDLVDSNASGLLVSVPGMGASFYCKHLLDSLKGVAYINETGKDLSNFNILDLDFDSDEQAIIKVDDYFKKAGVDQKFLVIVNRPDFIGTNKIGDTFFGRRVYKNYWFHANSLKETGEMVRTFWPEAKEEDIKKIYELTGGLGRLVKLLSSNRELMGLELEELVKREEVINLARPTALVVGSMSEEIGVKMGLVTDGEIVSGLIKYFVKENGVRFVDINVGEDMIVIEKKVRGEEITKLEKQIIEYSISSEDNVINKEKIAEFKWGEGSYDEFSDQAVSKTMQRLNSKLKKYWFEPLPKVGYKLRPK